MKKVVVLGGAGGIGRVAVEGILQHPVFDQVVVADTRLEAARAVVSELGDERLSALEVDAASPESLAAALEGATVALNCVGPFYRFGPPVLRAAIKAGVDFVDVCDDLSPTLEMLDLDGAAKKRGVKALIGMGNSPGIANLFVKLCADGLLEQVETADISHIHGGEPVEGPAVVKHRIRAMLDDIPLFVNGQFISVRQLEESGREHTVVTDFHRIGRFPAFPYPHPETITLPAHIPGLKRATNRGVIFPLSYFHLTQAMVHVGACGEEPIRVGDSEVIPIEFSVAHILARRASLLEEAGVTGPAGCLKVEVGGLVSGRPHRFVFQLSSSTAGAGEGTGIPAAAGALLMGMGGIEREGVYPPEAGVKPLELLALAFQTVKAMGKGGEDSILIEQIDADGNKSPVPLPF